MSCMNCHSSEPITHRTYGSRVNAEGGGSAYGPLYFCSQDCGNEYNALSHVDKVKLIKRQPLTKKK